MIKRILVGLGGTPYAASKIRHTIELANRFDAHVTGVTIIDAARLADVGPIPVGGGAAATKLREWREHEAQTSLESAIEKCKIACQNADIPCHIVREDGDEFSEFTSLWRYHDLTVLGLRGLFEYGVITDPLDSVVRLLARGVRPIIAVAREYRPVRNVLIAYNGSMESAKAMKQFVQLQLWPEAQLQIATFGDDADEAKRLLYAAKDYCAAHGYSARCEFVQGDSHDQLHKYAEKIEVDMVVMGASNRGRLARLVLGDTVKRMIREADIPLFLTQ